MVIKMQDMNTSKRKKAGRKTQRKIKKPSLAKAIGIAGSVTKLALNIHVHHSRISVWLYTNERIPAEHVIKIVQFTNGKIRPEELRADINWELPSAPEK